MAGRARRRRGRRCLTGVLARHGETGHEFALASLTKPVVSTAILVAVEEGVVTLDDAVDDRGATLRHLLAHAAGYPFDGRSPVAAPGTRRIYSNTGIELAAGLVEAASGMSFATYFHEAVIAPLGLGVELRGSPAHGAHGSVDGFVAVRRRAVAPGTARHDDGHRHAHRAVPRRSTASSLPSAASARARGGSAWRSRAPSTRTGRPHACSPATFGHFGGAGTFCWVDPAADLALVAFTDRSFIEWRDEAMRLWPALGDAVLGAIGAVAPGGDPT